MEKPNSQGAKKVREVPGHLQKTETEVTLSDCADSMLKAAVNGKSLPKGQRLGQRFY